MVGDHSRSTTLAVWVWRCLLRDPATTCRRSPICCPQQACPTTRFRDMESRPDRHLEPPTGPASVAVNTPSPRGRPRLSSASACRCQNSDAGRSKGCRGHRDLRNTGAPTAGRIGLQSAALPEPALAGRPGEPAGRSPAMGPTAVVGRTARTRCGPAGRRTGSGAAFGSDAHRVTPTWLPLFARRVRLRPAGEFSRRGRPAGLPTRRPQ
jgi:hypothetical protein